MKLINCWEELVLYQKYIFLKEVTFKRVYVYGIKFHWHTKSSEFAGTNTHTQLYSVMNVNISFIQKNFVARMELSLRCRGLLTLRGAL